MQPKRTRTRSAAPRLVSLALIFLLAGLALCFVAGLGAASPLPTSGKPAKFPAWWFEQEAIKPNSPAPAPLPATWPRYPQDYPAADDFTALKQGQLKQLATAAFDELEAHLFGRAGLPATTLIKSWFETDASGAFIYDSGTGRRIPKVTAGQTNDYAPVNLGQLKAVAEPFYDRLIAIGYRSSYPWTNPVSPANDFALANLGQAKNLFAFDPAHDSDGDGIPDWWEDRYGLHKDDPADATLDADGDGFSNLYEYQHHTDPNDYYNGALPVITVVSGNGINGGGQTTEPAAWLPEALVVLVTKAGFPPLPLANAPVRFDVAMGHGKIAASSGATPFSSLTVLTDATGHAQVSYHQPDKEWVPSRITVTAVAGKRTAQTGFQARTTAYPPGGGPGGGGPGPNPADDPDGDWDHDGLTNAEEMEIGSDPQSAQSDDDGVADGADAMPADSDISFPRAGAPHYALIDIGEGSISAINGKGQVVGMVPAAQDTTDDPTAFFWDKGTRKFLQGRKPEPHSINDSGAIVGSAEFAVPGVADTYNVRAAHWADADSEPTDLGSLGKITTTGSSEEDKQKKPGEWGTSVAVAINNNGMIVGESTHTVPAKPSPNSLTGSSAASGGPGRTTVNLQRPAPSPMPAPGVPSRKAATVPRVAPSSTPSGSPSRKAVRFNVGGKPTLLGPGKKDDIKISNYVIALSEGGVAVGMTHSEDTDDYSGAALWDNGTFSKDLGEKFTPTGVTTAPSTDTHYKYYVTGSTTDTDPPGTGSDPDTGTRLMLRSKDSDSFVTKNLPTAGAIGITSDGLAFVGGTDVWRNGKDADIAADITAPDGSTFDGVTVQTASGIIGGSITISGASLSANVGAPAPKDETHAVIEDTAVEVRAVIRGGSGKEVSTKKLWIDRLYDAFLSSGNLAQNWLEASPDRFYIQVISPDRTGDGTMMAKISTTNTDSFYNSVEREVTLKEIPEKPGVFRSLPQLLVSDKKDDEKQWKTSPPNTKDDATHLIALGGEVWLEYKTKDGKNTTRSKIATVDVTRVIKVKPFILKAGSDDVLTIAQVQLDLRTVRERLAPLGIRVDYDTPSHITANPAGVSPDGLAVI